jgi:hypothetical protein
VVAGDIIYRGVHAWTRETTAAQRKAWRAALDQLAIILQLGADAAFPAK